MENVDMGCSTRLLLTILLTDKKRLWLYLTPEATGTEGLSLGLGVQEPGRPCGPAEGPNWKQFQTLFLKTQGVLLGTCCTLSAFEKVELKTKDGMGQGCLQSLVPF